MRKPAETVCLGVLGPGRIAYRATKDIARAKSIRLYSVASRDAARAAAFSKARGDIAAYGSYREMADCRQTRLVYIATPHVFHCEQAVLMMEHGKHVICEKPMALNDAQARRMARCARANGVLLMEAMWTRFFPAVVRLREIVESGAIGEVCHVYAEMIKPYRKNDDDRFFNPALGGGALLDLGVYALSAATMLLGCAPSRVEGFCQRAETGVDLRSCVALHYPSGASAQLVAAMAGVGEGRQIVYGTLGRIEMKELSHPIGFTLIDAAGGKRRFRFPAERDGYWREFQHAAELVLGAKTDSPLMPLSETIRVSEIMTGLRKQWGQIYPGETQ